MEINEFVTKFAEQFEETDASVFTVDTKFKDLEEWSSLMELYIIIMVSASYNVEINGQEIKKCTTVEDVYNLVKSRE